MRLSDAMYLRRIRIRTRLILSFVILSFFPITLVGFLSVFRTYNDMETKAREYSYDISSHIVNNITYLFNDYIDKFERIALNSTILADIYNYEDLKEYRQIEVDNRIRYTLASIVGIGEGIDSIEIRSNDGERFYYSYPISRKEISESNLIETTLDKDGIVWSISEKEIEGDNDIYIILSKKMQIQFAEEITGWALMTINRNYIDEVCRQNRQSKNSYTVITDTDGIIISHPD